MGSYRYGFNGKENDDEVKGEGNQLDYGMRVYDPRIGKFLSVDPLTKSYPELTPYQFSGNTPIQATDLDGAETYIQRQGNANRDKARIGIVKEEQLKRESESWKYREPEIAIPDIYGNGHIGPESIQRYNVAAIKEEHDDALAETLKGPFASAGYLYGGEESAYKWSVADGVMVSFGGIPTENSRVFPRRTGIQPVRSVAYTEARSIRFFGKMDPLVRTTAEAIEAAMANSVLSVERQIMNPQTGKPLTDFDIELNNYIIEVNDGAGTGKLRQIQNNIQPNTKKK